MPIAIFAGKSFKVSSRSIYTFSDFKTSSALETESQDVAGKKPSTYIKGPGLDPISLGIPVKVEYGVNPMAEYKGWKAILEAAKPYPFILAGKPFGSNKWLLKEVGLENSELDSNGNILSALIQLTFQEYVRSGSASAKSSKTSKTQSGTYVDQFVNTPTASQKETAKRYNPNTKMAYSGRSSDAL